MIIFELFRNFWQILLLKKSRLSKGGLVIQKLLLSCSFRCDQKHYNIYFVVSRSSLSCLSPTKMFNKHTSEPLHHRHLIRKNTHHWHVPPVLLWRLVTRNHRHLWNHRAKLNISCRQCLYKGWFVILDKKMISLGGGGGEQASSAKRTSPKAHSASVPPGQKIKKAE